MLKVNNVTFAYDETIALSNISFKLNKGSHLSIIGESGSGKSTLLKLIHGEHDINFGNIEWNNTPILGPAYNLIKGYSYMKYVSQNQNIMPFTTVEENIGHYLTNMYPQKKQERIKELIHIVGLEGFEKTKVKLLSGGQKQRVTIARAIAKRPEVILLDEPFSYIDNFKKHFLRKNLFNYFKKYNITCITATHDKNDILGFSDNVIVLHDSKIISNTTAEYLYFNPKNEFVAAFFGFYSILKNANNEDTYVYSHQLKVTKQNPDIVVKVTQSIFKGSFYLIEAEYDNSVTYFNHNVFLEKNTMVSLKKCL